MMETGHLSVHIHLQSVVTVIELNIPAFDCTKPKCCSARVWKSAKRLGHCTQGRIGMFHSIPATGTWSGNAVCLHGFAAAVCACVHISSEYFMEKQEDRDDFMMTLAGILESVDHDAAHPHDHAVN